MESSSTATPVKTTFGSKPTRKKPRFSYSVESRSIRKTATGAPCPSA